MRTPHWGGLPLKASANQRRSLLNTYVPTFIQGIESRYLHEIPFQMVLVGSIENWTEPFKIELTEVEQLFHYESSLTDKVYGALTICAIFLTNCPLLRYIFKNGNTSVINKLVAIDCCLCIGITIPIFTKYILGKSRDPLICPIGSPYGYFIHVLNSLLSMGTVTLAWLF